MRPVSPTLKKSFLKKPAYTNYLNSSSALNFIINFINKSSFIVYVKYSVPDVGSNAASGKFIANVCTKVPYIREEYQVVICSSLRQD